MSFSYKEWYAQNKEARNLARRAKYEADPNYREKVQKANTDSRTKAAAAGAAEEAEAGAARKTALPERDWKERLETVTDPATGEETEILVFSIGALAAATNRSIQVLRQWEKSGVIPKPFKVTAKGDRLYTADQIADTVESLTKAGRLVNTLRQKTGVPSVMRTIEYADGEREETALYKVSVLAKVLGRTIVTVQHYEERGLLPKTPFRASSRNYRLYTLEQLEAVREIAPGYMDDMSDATRVDECREKILAAWREMNLLDAKLVDEPEPEKTT